MPPTLLVAASSLTMPWSLPIPSLPSPPTSLQVPCLKFYCSFLIDIIFFISLTFLSHPKQSQVHSWIIDAVGREAVVYFHLIWCSGILLHEVTQFVEDRNAEFKDCQDDIRDALFSTTSGLSTVRRAFLALRHLFVTSKDVAAGAVSDIIEVADLAAPSLAFIALLDASLEVRARPPPSRSPSSRHHHHYLFTAPHRVHFVRVLCCVRLRPMHCRTTRCLPTRPSAGGASSTRRTSSKRGGTRSTTSAPSALCAWPRRSSSSAYGENAASVESTRPHARHMRASSADHALPRNPRAAPDPSCDSLLHASPRH